ncbi:hypothetical protein DERA104750_09500 [Deinococcus radiodurans]
MLLREVRQHPIEALPGEIHGDFREVEVQATLRQYALPHLSDDAFAFDEHAIEVEQHGVEWCVRHQVSLSGPPSQPARM